MCNILFELIKKLKFVFLVSKKRNIILNKKLYNRITDWVGISSEQRISGLWEECKSELLWVMVQYFLSKLPVYVRSTRPK